VEAPILTRRTLFAGVLVAISLFGDSYLYAALPIHHAEAGISLGAVGWLLSANRWVRFFTNPLAGLIGARIGWGVAFAVALWLASITTASYGLLKGAVLLIVARALWGLCWSFLRLGGMAAVLADSPTGRRGRFIGIFTGVFRLGSVVGVAAGGYLSDQIGFGNTALLFGAATAVGAVLATLPPALSGRWGAPGRAETEARAVADSHLAIPGLGLRHHWLPIGGAEWVVSLSAAVSHMIMSGLVTATLSLLIKERLGSSIGIGSWMVGAATLTGVLLGSRFLLDLLVGPLAGHWADRNHRGAILTLATVLMAVSVMVLGQAATLWTVALGAVAAFGTATAMATVLDAWAGDLAGRAPGRFLPAYSTWVDLGAATGPLLGIYLATQVGLSLTYGAGALMLIVILAVRIILMQRFEAKQTAHSRL